MTFIIKKNKGITLLEILIALTIIVSVLMMSISFIKKKENAIRKTFRQLISLNRQLDHYARLKQQTYRLVIQLDKKKNSWWIETKKFNNPSKDKKLSVQNNTLFVKEFSIDKRFFKKPQVLPMALTFHSIEFSNKKLPITKGKAYIYYFPNGQFNLTLLQLKGKKNYWSIFIDRLKGDLTIFNGQKSLKDFTQ